MPWLEIFAQSRMEVMRAATSPLMNNGCYESIPMKVPVTKQQSSQSEPSNSAMMISKGNILKFAKREVLSLW